MMEHRTKKSMNELFNAYGGKEKYANFLEEQQKEVSDVFNQDLIKIGKILRSHLYVEYFMIKYLEYKNIDTNNKSFNEKINLLKDTAIYSAALYEVLVILNRLRNKIAHSLKYNINNQELEELKNNLVIKKYFFLYEKDNKYTNFIERYELFSQFIAQELNNGSNDKYYLTENVLYDTGQDACDMYFKED